MTPQDTPMSNTGSTPDLPPVSEKDVRFLRYMATSDQIVEWVQDYARAALSHHEDGGRAATMVLVPREPTPEMIDALVHQKNLEGGDRWVCRNSSAVAIYKAAVNAFNEKEPRHG